MIGTPRGLLKCLNRAINQAQRLYIRGQIIGLISILVVRSYLVGKDRALTPRTFSLEYKLCFFFIFLSLSSLSQSKEDAKLSNQPTCRPPPERFTQSARRPCSQKMYRREYADRNQYYPPFARDKRCLEYQDKHPDGPGFVAANSSYFITKRNDP